MSDVETIAALLAKAERTDNTHEAEAYLAKAQHLATLRSVDLAMVRARSARAQQRSRPVQRTVTIGERGKRANTHLVSLFVAVAQANDVVVDVARTSTFVVGYGMPTDLDLVEQLWGSLAHQMVDAAGRYLDAGEWCGETYRRVVRQRVGRWSVPRVQERPHTRQTARAAFYQGFIERIGARLADAHAEAVAQRVAESAAAGDRPPAGGPSAEVVLQAKADEVQTFYRHATSARGSWTGYRGVAGGDTGAARGAGRTAASNARIGTPREVGGAGPELTS